MTFSSEGTARLAWIFLFLNSVVFAGIKADRDLTFRTVHEVRALMEIPGERDPARVERVVKQLEILTSQPEEFKILMRFVERGGLLDADPFVADLEAIFAQIAQGPEADERRAFLHGIGFDRLALQIAAPTLGELSDPESPAESPASALRTIHEATLNHLKKVEDFVASAKHTERVLYRIHTLLMGLGVIGALMLGQEFVHLPLLTPKETVGVIGGLWTANNASYFYLWQRFGFAEWLKKIFSNGTYSAMRKSWSHLLTLNPRLATPLAAAAALDKPVSLEGVVGALEDAPLDALLADRSATPEARDSLTELGMKMIDANRSARASRIFREILRRRPGTQEAEMATRIRAALKAKRKLESAVFNRQLSSAVFRAAALGLGAWALNEGAEHFLREEVARWRPVAFAGTAAIGSRRIFNFLWKPLSEESLDYLFWRRGNLLVAAFRRILELDPSGVTVARIAQSDNRGGSRKFIIAAAIEAMRANPSGPITKTMMQMLEKELVYYTVSSASLRPVADAVFQGYRSCQSRLTDVRTKAAAAF